MPIPNIPIPRPIRRALLSRALWDELRTELSYDQALTVKPDAEAAVAAVVADMIAKGKRL